MKIPLIYADKPMQVTMAPAGQGWRARGAVADETQNLMGNISKHQAVLQEKERIAQDTLTSVKLDNTMRQKFSALEESFLSRTDYENFDKDKREQIRAIKDELQPQNASNEVTISFERSFNRNSSSASDNITARKYKVLDEQGRIEIGQSVDNAATEYASATDEITKKIITKRTELEIRRAIDSNLVDPVWGENQIRSIETLFKQKEVDLADVAADQAIMANPADARVKLKDKNYLPNLPPKARQDKLEKAEKAFKVQKSEQDSKLTEAKKLAHDKEERDISDLYMQGDHTGAFIKTLDSKFLSGDERMALSDKIRKDVEYSEKPDVTKNALNIIMANGMIERGEEPNKIRNFITYNPNLEKTDREQYLNKLDSKLTSEIKDGRSRGYRDIVNIIFPRAFDLMGIDPNQISEADIGKILNSSKISPEQVIGIAKTQIALDSWINAQVSSNKYPTSAEIRMKALELVGSYQMSIGDKVEFWRNQLNQ